MILICFSNLHILLNLVDTYVLQIQKMYPLFVVPQQEIQYNIYNNSEISKLKVVVL